MNNTITKTIICTRGNMHEQIRCILNQMKDFKLIDIKAINTNNYDIVIVALILVKREELNKDE